MRKAVWEISLPVSGLAALDYSSASSHGLRGALQGTALAETDAKGGTDTHPNVVFDRSQYVAIPKYMHDKPVTDDGNVSGNAISKAFGNDLIGDSLQPTEKGNGVKELPDKEVHTKHHGDELEEHGDEHAHGHGHVAILYFIVDLVLGAILQYCLERMLPNCPYTVALFLAGCIMGVSHFSGWSKHVWPTWYQTVAMWQTINPHMLFFAFLPTLIFGEAMRLNAQLVKQCLGQILLLACPGVLIGTFLTGAFAVYVLPYGWDWPIALVFGAILSATDPVAVVALFNTLGVSPRLTMLISGESLLNDGTAIAAFALMFKVVLGAHVDGWGIAVFFGHMIFSSVLWGVVLGSIVVYFLGLCAEEKQPSDLMLQVIITICASYLSFFIAESEFSTSGVLATVVCGFVVALNGWPRFVSREAVITVWEAIEFIGNTVIFFLAGMLFVYNVMTRRQYIGMADVFWLFILYFALTAIRTIMVLMLWPFLNALGAPIGKHEVVVMIWSGLRGAVALAMAIIVDQEEKVPEETGSRIMFLIGGLAAMTTLLNASTTAALLKYLDLTKTTEMKERCLSTIAHDIHLDVSRKFEEKMAGHEDLRCQGAIEDLVREMVPALKAKRLRDEEGTSYPLPAELQDRDASKTALTEIYRNTFLQVVRTHYWEAIEAFMVPKCGLTARYLLESVDEAMDQTWGSLNDWAALERKLDIKAVQQPPSFLSRIVGTWPFSLSSELRGMYSRERIIERIVNCALTFMEVHTRAQKEVPHIFLGVARNYSEGSTGDAIDEEASQAVIKESAAQFHRVIEVLNILPTTSVEISKSKMFARELLWLQSSRLEWMQRKGFLTDSEVDKLEEEIHIALRKLVRTNHADWLATTKMDRSGSPSESPAQGLE